MALEQKKRNSQSLLSNLNSIDWDFVGENGTGGLSAYHWYPARYVQQIPGILISYLSEPGDYILDPFCGSGTTLVEAYRFGRRALGIDLNPIAVLMTQSKLTSFTEKSYANYRNTILSEAVLEMEKLSKGLIQNRLKKCEIENLTEIADWYHNDTLIELIAIWNVLHNHNRSKYSSVGLATFSSILKYANSQDKHWGWICDNVKPKKKEYKKAYEKFKDKLDNYKLVAKELHDEALEFSKKPVSLDEVRVEQGDCQAVLSTIPANTFDLIITSPPYYNMVDYLPSQRLSLLWFGRVDNKLLENEIGARRKRARKGSLEQYLNQMETAFSSVCRVLKKGKYFCMVIGESPKNAPFLEKLEESASKVGFHFVDSIERSVSKQRSLHPVLVKEKVIIFQKQ